MAQTKSPNKKYKVEAPSNLPGGYILDVEIDGKPIQVKVPPGGVRKGETFEATAVSSTTTNSTSQKDTATKTKGITVVSPHGETKNFQPKKFQQNNNKKTTPTPTPTTPDDTFSPIQKKETTKQRHKTNLSGTKEGSFSTDLFDCPEVCCSSLWWMSCYMNPIVIGQVLQRMKLNVAGYPGKYQYTCKIMTAAFSISFMLFITLATYFIGYVFLLIFIIFYLFAHTKLRGYLRKENNVPGDDCNDCLRASFCFCCSAIQLARHTHNEKVYPYTCWTETGLDATAPEMV